MLSPVARSTESFRLTFHWVTFKALESDSVDSSNNKSQSGQPFGTPLRKVLNRRSFALAYQCQSSLWLHVDVHSQFTDHLLARLHGETDGVFYGTRSTRFYSRVTKRYESFAKVALPCLFYTCTHILIIAVISMFLLFLAGFVMLFPILYIIYNILILINPINLPRT